MKHRKTSKTNLVTGPISFLTIVAPNASLFSESEISKDEAFMTLLTVLLERDEAALDDEHDLFLASSRIASFKRIDERSDEKLVAFLSSKGKYDELRQLVYEIKFSKMSLTQSLVLSLLRAASHSSSIQFQFDTIALIDLLNDSSSKESFRDFHFDNPLVQRRFERILKA